MTDNNKNFQDENVQKTEAAQKPTPEGESGSSPTPDGERRTAHRPRGRLQPSKIAEKSEKSEKDEKPDASAADASTADASAPDATEAPRKKPDKKKKKKKTGDAGGVSLRRAVSRNLLVIDSTEEADEEDEASAIAAEAQELYDDIEPEAEVLSSRIIRTGTTPTFITGVIKSVVYLVSVLVVSIFLAVGIIIVGNDMFALIKDDVSVSVTIPDEISIEELTDLLYENKIINCPYAFKLYASIKGVNTSLFVGGEYTVSSMMNYEMLCSLFIPVKQREIVRVTIPEGSTVQDIIEIFTSAGIGTERGFVDAINNYDYAQYFDFVKAIDDNDPKNRIYRLEGYLYPDTYDFYSDAKETQIIYKLLENFDIKFSKQMRADARDAGYTVDQIIILASMVQKETYLSDDFDMTASVFVNRLRDPETYPKLESDATTAYAIEMATGVRPDTIGEEEILFESPYNTRISEGLPPSAICNPGYDAIMCTIYPAASEMYYFVTDNTGKNIYAATYAEHLENVARVKAESEEE